MKVIILINILYYFLGFCCLQAESQNESNHFEILAKDYAIFLNEVSVQDSANFYDEKMASATEIPSILRSDLGGRYTYTIIKGRENSLVPFLSWYDAASYCRWKDEKEKISVGVDTTYFLPTAFPQVDLFLKSNVIYFSIFNTEKPFVIKNGRQEKSILMTIAEELLTVGALLEGTREPVDCLESEKRKETNREKNSTEPFPKKMNNGILMENGCLFPLKGGCFHENIRYSQHALERMAPETPEIMKILMQRAIQQGEALGLKITLEALQTWKKQSEVFQTWWKKYRPEPRTIFPATVEKELASPGSTDVVVITGRKGTIVTVFKRRVVHFCQKINRRFTMISKNHFLEKDEVKYPMTKRPFLMIRKISFKKAMDAALRKKFQQWQKDILETKKNILQMRLQLSEQSRIDRFLSCTSSLDRKKSSSEEIGAREYTKEIAKIFLQCQANAAAARKEEEDFLAAQWLEASRKYEKIAEESFQAAIAYQENNPTLGKSQLINAYYMRDLADKFVNKINTVFKKEKNASTESPVKTIVLQDRGLDVHKEVLEYLFPPEKLPILENQEEDQLIHSVADDLADVALTPPLEDEVLKSDNFIQEAIPISKEVSTSPELGELFSSQEQEFSQKMTHVEKISEYEKKAEEAENNHHFLLASLWREIAKKTQQGLEEHNNAVALCASGNKKEARLLFQTSRTANKEASIMFFRAEALAHLAEAERTGDKATIEVRKDIVQKYDDAENYSARAHHERDKKRSNELTHAAATSRSSAYALTKYIDVLVKKQTLLSTSNEREIHSLIQQSEAYQKVAYLFQVAAQEWENGNVYKKGEKKEAQAQQSKKAAEQLAQGRPMQVKLPSLNNKVHLKVKKKDKK